MAVNWSCPVKIDDSVAMGIQAVLARIDAFELTEENATAFIEYNSMAKILTRNREPVTRDDIQDLIGFRYNY